MISHKHRFIFIHMYKTAGVSVIDFFQKSCKRNLILHQGTEDSKWNSRPKEYFIFTIVRNPWDRFISGWKYLRETRNLTLEKLIAKIPSIRKSKQGKTYLHIARAQLTTLTDEKGTLVPDYILRFENIDEDWKTLCNKLNIKNRKLPHSNITPHKHYSRYYTDKTREAIYNLYKEDIDYFDYKFEIV